jgi:hypothetical protein
METVRESWTDERLDDLREGVADFRREANEEFAAVRLEMREEFAAVRLEMREEFRAVRREMQDGFSALNTRFDAMQGSFDALQRTIIQIGGGMAAAFCAALIGLIATQL